MEWKSAGQKQDGNDVGVETEGFSPVFLPDHVAVPPSLRRTGAKRIAAGASVWPSHADQAPDLAAWNRGAFSGVVAARGCRDLLAILSTGCQ